MDSLFRQLFKGFVRQEFRLESYITFPKGHWLDLLELLLAHLGDDALTELQALVSGFVSGFPTMQAREWEKNSKVLAYAGDCIKLFKNDRSQTKCISKKQNQI